MNGKLNLTKLYKHNQFFITFILFAIAVLYRIINSIIAIFPPNVEIVTATSLGAVVLAKRNSSITPFSALIMIVISDTFIGTSPILFFTWSAWIVIGFIELRIRTQLLKNPIMSSLIFSIFSSTFFFLWTNLGVWFLSAGKWYTSNLSGLISCYASGIPFYRNMLLSDLVLCPIMVLLCRSIIGSEKTLTGILEVPERGSTLIHLTTPLNVQRD